MLLAESPFYERRTKSSIFKLQVSLEHQIPSIKFPSVRPSVRMFAIDLSLYAYFSIFNSQSRIPIPDPFKTWITFEPTFQHPIPIILKPEFPLNLL